MAIKGGYFTENSDIDLLIKFKDIPFEKYADNYFKLHELFENMFGRKVDLMTENSLSNPYLLSAMTSWTLFSARTS
ncbi:hypothetical protein EPICR_140027 [Candidatus Desulfarcum epimagneticum]|uniref:Polymerase nucleotidyl transferase domain-containing protein n=1 Tax=uncultured Desulfobacteraceae bacterium TaxID=218296 RepID=A0A484HDK9_9BACT|nr:hypothetical protein EPICR_140027 [uncultured Desulfobacteraceae bacterium]